MACLWAGAYPGGAEVSLRSITATFECDGCGQVFSVELDPALKRPSLMDAAEEAMKGSLHCHAPNHNVSLGAPGMGDDGQHLCPKCVT